jgi:hypothetical protein
MPGASAGNRRRDGTVLAAWETFITRPAGNTRGTMTPRGLIDAAALAMLAVVLGEREHLELPLVGSAVDNTHPSDGSRLDASGPRRTIEAAAPAPSAPESTAPGNDVTGTDTSGPGTSGPATVSFSVALVAPADTAVPATVDASKGATPGGADDP